MVCGFLGGWVVWGGVSIYQNPIPALRGTRNSNLTFRLDASAAANFTFSHLWLNNQTPTIANICICLLFRRSCPPIIVKPKFGKHCI